MNGEVRDASKRMPVVLFVDDEPAVLSALKRAFQNEPYGFASTDDPRQALEWIRSRPIHLLVTDQRMPVLTGVELIRAARDASPETPCVILTAYPDTAVIVARGSLRFVRLMTKPWDDEELRRVVRTLLEERFPRADKESPTGTVLRVSVGCQEGDSMEILDRVRQICGRTEGREGRAVIVLENLRELRDSVPRLLKGLARLAVECDADITLLDSSGYLETFLDALGELKACGPGESPDQGACERGGRGL